MVKFPIALEGMYRPHPHYIAWSEQQLHQKPRNAASAECHSHHRGNSVIKSGGHPEACVDRLEESSKKEHEFLTRECMTCGPRKRHGSVPEVWRMSGSSKCFVKDSQVFKKYSQMKLLMKSEALDRINRRANEMSGVLTEQGLATGVLTHF